jgi:hypothetical protein
MKNFLTALALITFFASSVSSFANTGGGDKDKKGKKSCCSKSDKAGCSKDAAAKKSCGDHKDHKEAGEQKEAN